MTPLITADERSRLLANGRPALPGRTPTRCPWYACSPRMRMPLGCWLRSTQPMAIPPTA